MARSAQRRAPIRGCSASIGERYALLNEDPPRHRTAGISKPTGAHPGHLRHLPVREAEDLATEERSSSDRIELGSLRAKQAADRLGRILVEHAGLPFWSDLLEGDGPRRRLPLEPTPHPAADGVQEVGCGVGAVLAAPLGDQLEERGDEVGQEAPRIITPAPAPVESTSDTDEARQERLEQCSGDAWILGGQLQQRGDQLGPLELAQARIRLEQDDNVGKIADSSLSQRGVVLAEPLSSTASGCGAPDGTPLEAEVVELVVG